MKKFLAAAAVSTSLAGFSGAGWADDSIYDWSGFYAGVHAGYGFGETQATDTAAGGAWNVAGDTFTADTNGFVGGAQMGFNHQLDSLVFGIEADAGYLGAGGSEPTQNSTGVPFDTIVSSDGGLYATARLRAGFAFDRALIFATGGLLGADLGSKVDDSLAAQVHTDDTGFQVGWTVGAGLEFAMTDQLSLKAEYLYYDLGTDNVVGQPPTAIQDFDIENTGSILRAGLNFHF